MDRNLIRGSNVHKWVEWQDLFESFLSRSISTFLAEFMVHMMEAATMNSHEISHVTAPVNAPWFHGQPGRVGPVLDVYGSLLNHSCDPNTFWINHGKAIISFASKDINMDEEVRFFI